MRQRPSRSPLLACFLVLLAAPSAAQELEAWREMNRPVPPMRIAGNLYYVGASSVTSFLITTPDGHVLIDGGFVETVPIIRAGIEQLGFRLEDVKVLLNSHAHLDHAGGLAELKRLTGATMIASALEAPLLERGGLGDDLMGDEIGYPPVEVDRRLADGDTVELGGVTLTAHVTAGHTRGCTSWAFDVKDGERTYRALSICSLSILDGMKLVTEPVTYPGIADDYRRSIATLRALPVDLFLASHAGFFRMAKKRAHLEAGLAPGDPNPFVDPDGYRAYLDRAEEKLEQHLAAERQALTASAAGPVDR